VDDVFGQLRKIAENVPHSSLDPEFPPTTNNYPDQIRASCEWIGCCVLFCGTRKLRHFSLLQAVTAAKMPI